MDQEFKYFKSLTCWKYCIESFFSKILKLGLYKTDCMIHVEVEKFQASVYILLFIIWCLVWINIKRKVK